MWLRKNRLLPGGAPGDYEWKTDQDVVEVPDGLGLELVAIPDAGFVEVQPPASTEPDQTTEEAPTEVVEAPTTPKKRAARKTASSAESTEISE